MTNLARIAPARTAAARQVSNRIIAFPVPTSAGEAASPQPSRPALRFRPADIARCRSSRWSGLAADIFQVTRHEPVEYEFCAQFHLLIAYERGSRSAGETVVEGLPRSSLRDFAQKLSFVPAGARFSERQTPRSLMRAVVFYIDAQGPLLDQEAWSMRAAPVPRLFFEDAALWQTARKLTALIESGSPANAPYAEALGAVLAQELLYLGQGAPPPAPLARGGLSGWQRRIVAQHIEDNLATPISLAALAELARLSTFHFARAFKQSFGVPPHRYHTRRRIEKAKMLLATPMRSVTETALDVGFSETSSFTAAFHKLTGLTPTEYRRSLV
jgi:AraC family transcriptional regulator